MAELIQKQDTLNQGRVKLNAAITDAEKAKVDAVSAVNTSNQAKQIAQTAENKADSVQAQFDQVVIEGDSSVEAAQARVDTDGNPHTTLKARLDAEHTEVTAQLADITINADNFKAEIPESDDSGRLQRAIDYAHSLLGEYDKKIMVNFGNHIYDITGLTIPRGITLVGNSTLNVRGVGNIGLTYHSLHTLTMGIKVNLTEVEQVGIYLGSDESINTQFNAFINVWIEGNGIKDTTAVKFGKTWTNAFYSCYFLRCADGVAFMDDDSNANFFYDCEIRHTKAHENSKMAILHMNGKNNAFIGGVIETYQDGIDVRGGTLYLENVYTEDFQVDRPFHLSGDGILNFKNSQIKGKFQVRGGKALWVTGCDLSRGGVSTNNNSPLVRFEADVGTEVVIKNKAIPDNLVHARWGMWFDTSNSTWKERSAQNKKESYLDRDSIYMAYVSGLQNATGDGSRAVVPFDINTNPYGELTSNEFAPISDGVYSIKINVRIEGLTDSFGNCTLYLREKGSGGREFVLDSQHARSRDGNGRMTLKGNIETDIKNLLSCDFLISVSGSSKTIGIMGSSSSSVHGSLNIKRIA